MNHCSLFTVHCSLFTLPAFAKINLSLRVLGKRPDGYHEICTTLNTVSLCDYLTFEQADEISLSCGAANSSVPTDQTNLVVRAANLLRERFSTQQGAKIHLEKRIPSPGGLGGGSADAAVTLIALTHFWKIKTSGQSLIEIAETLGADVPFFLYGGTAFATGAGTEIEILPNSPKKLLVIVTPNEMVSTAEAYRSLNAPSLTEVDSLSILTICRSARIDSNSNRANLKNDFENTIFSLKPEIERVRNKLLEFGASHALMSGSGASVFGIFDNERIREKACCSLRDTEADWRIFSCETVSQNEYKQALSPCWNLPKNL
ncbi:MAG: 4-(cytidine 5'-diphospho)-2-C-methyl-D-erythritol kinase [Pyrinomonadaceae bacterium]